ncbi:hypothetical protein OJAV_G00184030 [Oryzias javanicus]|uniref:Uncharacterized protein n=1 Tax=Oryzias javanicus TaxID=123683 RepID=A0A437CD50_ORYJA|nr:hypothetical protein OJAV_G00184030 [Oryzias javanicus]
MKMSCSEEEDDIDKSSGFSDGSLKRTKSKESLSKFTTEASNTLDQQLTEKDQSSDSSCASVKSDRSKNLNPHFKNEPGPSESKKMETTVFEEMSEEVLNELYLDQYKTSREGRWRLIPAVRNCRKFRMGFVSKPSEDDSNIEFSCYELSKIDCEAVAFALKSNPSHLTELDLSGTILLDSAVKILCAGLKSQNCKLETLRLKSCSLSEKSCADLVSGLKSNPSHLTELVLDGNNLQDSGILHLCSFLESPDCKLKTLSLRLQTEDSEVGEMLSVKYKL